MEVFGIIGFSFSIIGMSGFVFSIIAIAVPGTIKSWSSCGIFWSNSVTNV